MTINGELQDCYDPCVQREAAVVHGEQIDASDCTSYSIEFDYDRDTTEITLSVPAGGRFALFMKDHKWTKHLRNNDECADGSTCHYVSVGGTPIWPSSDAFAYTCEESVQVPAESATPEINDQAVAAVANPALVNLDPDPAETRWLSRWTIRSLVTPSLPLVLSRSRLRAFRTRG
jgi:hypothetical protein